MTAESPELKKYNKRIEDLIEDAEIEAELEAESQIRSKNTRLFFISSVGLVSLILVYWSIYFKSEDAPPQQNPQLANSANYIPKPKPIPFSLDSKDKSQPYQKSASVASKPNSPSKIKSKISKDSEIKSLKSISQKPKPLPSSPAQLKSILAVPKKSSSQRPPASNYSIQMGVFLIENNANTFADRLKTKGLSPRIRSVSGQAETFSIFVGEFKDKKSGQIMNADLKQSGFSTKMQSFKKGLFSFTVGNFKTRQKAENLQDRLSKNGFLPGLHHNKGKTSKFIVSVGQYTSLKEAKLAQIKIKQLGYSKSFPKKFS